jgi:phospholipid/cholesterol/gamma-HCH transport system substrate-binding protein
VAASAPTRPVTTSRGRRSDASEPPDFELPPNIKSRKSCRVRGGRPVKRSESRQTVIGAVAVISFAVLLVLSYGGQALLSGGEFTGYRLHVMFNRVDGLTEEAPVYVSGIEVGRVQRMALVENNRAHVTLWIRPGIELPVDTAAAIHTDGLFGPKFMTLDPGGADAMLKDGDTITFSQDALIVSQLLELIISQGRAARMEGVQEETRGN